MRTNSLLVATLFAGLLQSSFASAQNWRTAAADGTVRIIDGGGTVIQVFGPNGNLVQTVPVVPPYLQSMGNIIFQQPDNSNLHTSRVPGSLRWQLSTNSPPTSTLPGYLELDGKWYDLAGGFVQAFYAPSDHSVSASVSNCRLSGGSPLPAAVAPKLNLNGVAISLALPPDMILIEHLENADTIRMKSRTGNIVCDGEVPSPIPLPDPMFKTGFEQVTYQLIELDADAGWTLVLLNADGSEQGRSEYPAHEFAERAALDSCVLGIRVSAQELACVDASADGSAWLQLC